MFMPYTAGVLLLGSMNVKQKTPHMDKAALRLQIFGQPAFEKVNEELFWDNPLHVILNKSKLAYRIYVVLIANKELQKIDVPILP
jgi:hypothetical protein